MTQQSQRLRERAEVKQKKAEAIIERANRFADNYPGSFITGASGRSRAQNRGTERGLNAVINASVQAKKLREDARSLLDRAWRLENPHIIDEMRANRTRERKERKVKERTQRRSLSLDQRLFIGVYPNAIVYCDMAREENNDFLEVGRLYLSDLTFEIYEEKSPLLPMVLADIERVQAMKGQFFQISACGQGIVLGWKSLEVV